MSLYISPYNPTSSTNDDQDVAEQQQRRERELRLRRRADQRSMQIFLEERQRDPSTQIHESMREGSQSLVSALLHCELDREEKQAPTDTVSLAPLPLQQLSGKTPSLSKPAVSGSQRQSVASRAGAPKMQVPRPGISAPTTADDMPIDAASAADDGRGAEVRHRDETVRGASRFDSLADHLDRMLSDLQSHVADGAAAVPRLFDMLGDMRRASSGLRQSEIDGDSTRRIDGACRFLSAYIDSMDCSDSERATLVRTLDENRHMIRAPDRTPLAQAERTESTGSDAGLEVEPEKDRQTLYAYLELLKSLQDPPPGGKEVRQVASRLAELQADKPSEALKRLARSGDHSVSLYIREISRRLQLADTRKHNVHAAGLRGKLGDWLEKERNTMQTAILQAEEINAYTSRKRTRDETRDLEARAETMPLVILQKA